MKIFSKFSLFFLMLIAGTAAYAHPHEAGGGVVTNFFHPHLGLEHFLALIVVGIVVARIVRRKS